MRCQIYSIPKILHVQAQNQNHYVAEVLIRQLPTNSPLEIRVAGSAGQLGKSN